MRNTFRACLWVVGICAAIGCGLLAGTGVAGQTPMQATADEYQQVIVPVLSKKCVSCHSDRLRTGNLSLEGVREYSRALQHTELWQKVLDKVSAGQMPPRPLPLLPSSEAAALVQWIRKLPGITYSAESAAVVDPGRVTARRLNRVEYNNTVRDLLGVTLRPADEFPVDDSGYGFDNIGDALSVSPMLMDKYQNAARAVARAAIFGEPAPEKPGVLLKLTPKKMQDNMRASSDVTPYSLRGALYATYHAPVDAEYEMRWHYGNYRGRGKPVGNVRPYSTAEAKTVNNPVDDGGQGRGRGAGAVNPGGQGAPRPALTEEQRLAQIERTRTAFAGIPMVLNVDGKQVYSTLVEGDGGYNYSRGEEVVRVRLSAGDHSLRISWPELANIPNPFRLINADGRQELFVEYLRILGPYAPATGFPPSYKNIFICGQPGQYTPQCVTEIVTNLATRAYRRPATTSEVQSLMSIVTEVQKNDSTELAIQMAIEAVLVSPNFLFRVERDPQPAAQVKDATNAATKAPQDNSYQITDYELASRLSYFLWSSMPDAELFRTAQQRRLHEPEVLNAQVQRMLASPKSSALTDNFGEQWLNLRLMDRTKPDADRYLVVDDELLDAMRQETRMFVDTVFRENRSILDFIDGRYTFVNGPLARYYGIRGVDGEQFQRVALDGEQRSGIVTQGAILSISSYATRTSPVLRGKWVLDTLLGAAPPPPPPDIPPLEEKDLGTSASMRQRLEQHRANPSCSVCHNLMDPIGFSLENYDAAGAWREKDGEVALDTAGTLPDGRTLEGAKGLKQILRADAPIFVNNFTEKLLTYALGRGLERTDRPVVELIAREAAHSEYRFAPLVTGIVNSRPFRMRTRAGGVE